MEWPWEQFELWPKKISPEELKEELEKNGRRGEKAAENLEGEEEKDEEKK